MGRLEANEAPGAGADSRRPFRCGYVALAGRPNVGKSTLLNALVGQHLSIVTRRAQTTRERVAGLLTRERCQILFIDTPGLIEPRYPLQAAMRWAITLALDEADVIVQISDASDPETLIDAETVELARSRSLPLIVTLNKCDLADAAVVERLRRDIGTLGYPALAISALSGEGLNELLERIVELLPQSPPLFPADEAATQPLRFFVGELVRETCMELFRDELPYSITCRVDEFRENQDPLYIAVVIYVERESQKGIVIGQGGSAIRQVGQLSRQKIEALVGARVYLDTRVKVLAAWSRKRRHLQRLGFRLPPAKAGQSGGEVVDN